MPKLVNQTSLPKSELTKKALTEAAYALFHEKGFDNVGVREIAAAVGLTTGSFYHHFRSKADILNYRAEQNSLFLTTELPNLIGHLSFSEKIEEIFCHYLCDILVEDGWELCEDRMFVQNYRKRQDNLLMDMVEDIIKEGQKSGEIISNIDASHIMNNIFIVFRGVEYDWCINSGNYILQEKMREHIHIIISHYLK